MADVADVHALLELSPRCPWRPLDWRLRLAELRVEHGVRRARRLDDDWVRRLVAHMRNRRRRPGWATADADVESALRVAHAGPRERLAVEARLLAGMDDEQVADRAGLAPGVVAAFEAACFDVRGRLDATDHVTFLAVDPGGALHTGPPDLLAAARGLAYRGGPLVAEMVLEALADDRDDGPVGGDRMGLRGLVRHAVGFLALPAGSLNPWIAIRLYAHAVELRHAGASSAVAGGLRPTLSGGLPRGPAPAGVGLGRLAARLAEGVGEPAASPAPSPRPRAAI